MEANRQGNALLEAGRYEEAIPVWRKALELGENEFGPNDPTTAALLDALAQTYHRQGRYAEAEPLYERSLAIREKALGPDHPLVAAGLNNLAALYYAQVVAGSEIAESAQALLERPEVAYLHLRSASNNCYQCRIKRS